MEIERLLVIPGIGEIEPYVELAREYGCGFEYNDFFSPAILDNEQEMLDRIETYKAIAPSYTTLHGAFLDINICSADSLIREASDRRVRQCIEVAIALEARGVVFHTNFIANFNQTAYKEAWVSDNVTYWKNILAEYQNIEIYIENMFDMDWELSAKLGELMKDEERFGLCLDYAHAHVFGDEHKVKEWVEAVAPYVKHLHINDNDFISDLHLGLGKGLIDWNLFKEMYEKHMNKASVLIEVSDYDTAKQSLEFLKNL